MTQNIGKLKLLYKKIEVEEESRFVIPFMHPYKKNREHKMFEQEKVGIELNNLRSILI